MNTKKRILFVDDETLILDGLKRSLRGLREQWDMDFSTSGALALEAMALRPFDVIVSDMRMPGMNGAELLNEVMLRYPKTLRFILSGHAENDLIMKCVGSTHQYLSKPCDGEALKAALARATSLGFTLHTERIMTLVSKIQELPALPTLYTEMLKVLQQPEASMEDLGGIIAQDIAMTAKILKLINSAFFGLSHQVTNPVEAASYLGIEVIKSLVLATQTFSQFATVDIPGFSLDGLRRHSLQTSMAAKLIAQTEQADAQIISQAFAAGVLHDVGRLVLAANFHISFRASIILAQQGNLSTLEAEQVTFGATHAEIGGYLLGLWGLPVPVVEAIALHHTPSASLERGFSALTAVHVADALAHEESGGTPGPDMPQIDLAYLTSLGLQDRLPVWRAACQDSKTRSAAA